MKPFPGVFIMSLAFFGFLFIDWTVAFAFMAGAMCVVGLFAKEVED